MATNKKPKKKYRPLRAVQSAHQSKVVRTALASPMTEEHQAQVKANLDKCLATMTHGSPTRLEAEALLEASLMAYVADKRYFTTEDGYGQCSALLTSAIHALWAVFDRHAQGKALRFKAEELQLVQQAVDIHVQQAALLTYGEIQGVMIVTRPCLLDRDFFKRVNDAKNA